MNSADYEEFIRRLENQKKLLSKAIEALKRVVELERSLEKKK